MCKKEVIKTIFFAVCILLVLGFIFVLTSSAKAAEIESNSFYAVTKTANFGVGEPGRILSKTKILNGKMICANDDDHPGKSNKNPRGHIDNECCLDPDETPNSLCYYPQEKYAKFIQRYLKSIK